MGNPVGSTYAEELSRRGDRAHILDADRFYTLAVGSYSTRADNLVGCILWHRCADGVRVCGGFVRFVVEPEKPEKPVWTVESIDPLTISPSVLCRGEDGDCGGTHGFIRHGRWEAA